MATDQGFPPSQIIEPTSNHTHTIIILHRRGSNSKQFMGRFLTGRTTSDKSVIDEIAEAVPGCKWIFPSSRKQWAVTFEAQRHQWYDMISLVDPEAENELQVQGLREAILHINSIIDAEIAAGIPAQNIVLGGISQGCSVALHILATRNEKLGGFFGIAGWFPFSTQMSKLPNEELSLKFYDEILGLNDITPLGALETPCFMAHSADDTIINPDLGSQAYSILDKLGFTGEFAKYKDGGHWLQAPTGHDDLVRFLKQHLQA